MGIFPGDGLVGVDVQLLGVADAGAISGFWPICRFHQGNHHSPPANQIRQSPLTERHLNAVVAKTDWKKQGEVWIKTYIKATSMKSFQ